MKSYGAAALQRHRMPPKIIASPTDKVPSSLPAIIEARVKQLLWNDPGCLLLIWIGLLLAGLAYIVLAGLGAFPA